MVKKTANTPNIKKDIDALFSNKGKKPITKPKESAKPVAATETPKPAAKGKEVSKTKKALAPVADKKKKVAEVKVVSSDKKVDKKKKILDKEERMDKFYEAVAKANKTAGAQKVRRVTEDGYKIYTLEELGLGKGGETEDCPFDCNCCF